MSAKPVEHTGYKFLHLIFGLILAIVWSLFNFFQWITTIDPVVLTNYGYGLVGIIIYMAFAFLWELIWRFFHKFGTTLDEYKDDVGFKYLGLVVVLILGMLWTFFNFFSWLSAVNPIVLTKYAYGIVGVTILEFFVFIMYILWAFFHKASSKIAV